MQNEKRKIKILSIIFFSVFIFSTANFAFAWSWGKPISPCGGSYIDSSGNPVNQPECTSTCDFLALTKNVIDFITYGVLPVVGTFFFIVGGFFILLGGAKPDMLSKGKSIIWSTVMGIIIILVAWLITNTLINSLIEPGKIPLPWSDVTCVNGEIPIPGGGGGGGGTQCPTNETCILGINDCGEAGLGGSGTPCTSGGNDGILCCP